MDWLTSDTQITQAAYPVIFFYAIAIIGSVLILLRPYWAFLFSVFFLVSRNLHAAVFTRALFGAYLNLNDLLLWIALIAMLTYVIGRRKKIWFPTLLMAIFVILIVGDIQSFLKYGFNVNTMRDAWQNLTFPLFILIAANMLNEKDKVKHFFWVLFFGAILAAIQHLFFIYYNYHIYGNDYNMLRIISYIFSGGLFLVVSSLYHQTLKMNRLRTVLFYFCLGLIGISYILSFTRGIYIYIMAIFLIFPFILGKKIKRYLNMILTSSLIFTFAFFSLNMLLPELKVADLVLERADTISSQQGFLDAYDIRLNGAKTELEIWLRSPIIGVGSSYPPEVIAESPTENGILTPVNHFGFTTYLAHFGIIGLMVYGIIIPVMTIKLAKKYYLYHRDDIRGTIGLIAIAAALFDIIGLAWSQHHLDGVTGVSGLIYGAFWTLYLVDLREIKQQKILTRVAIND